MLTRADAAGKPLLGFGWAGWLMLLPLIALVAVVLTGYDLRYRIQELVLECFGLDALFNFTNYGIVHTALVAGIWPPEPRFGPIALMIVLVALQVHPRRVGAIRLALVYALGVLGPALLFWFMARPLRGWLVSTPAGSPGMLEIGGIAYLALASTVLWLAVRSWRVALLCLACLGLPVVVECIGLLAEFGDLPLSLANWSLTLRPSMGAVMHLSLAAVLWTWAIHARLQVLPPHVCHTCGYDLRGSPSTPCPECGTPPEQAVDSPSPAAPAGDPEPSPRSPA